MAEFKRSRIERKNEEQITKKTIFLGVLTIFVFISVLIFGLPLLIKFSVFLGESKSKKDTQKENIVPPLAPRFTVPFEATNSATLNINGFAEPKTTVELFKNDVSLNKIEVSDSGDFSFENVSLDDGGNDFSAIATKGDNTSSDKSKILTISYDKTNPELTLTNPNETSLTVDSADFDVVGKTEAGVSVSINGRIAAVDDSGNFKLKIQLNSGNNDIEIIVTDAAGNKTTKKITIKYDI